MTRHNASLNHQRNLQHQHAVDHAVRNATGDDTRYPNGDDTQHPTYTDPADARQLRGIPAIGGRGSMGGAIIGSRPDTLGWVDDRKQKRRSL